MALGQVFLRILQFFISLILHIHSQLNYSLLSEGQVGEVWQLSTQQCSLGCTCDLDGKIFPLSVLKVLQVRWQDFFARRILVLVCQANAFCKLCLKILHLLRLVVSEMNSFCFRLVPILSDAQLMLAVTLQDKIHLPSNTKSITKNQDPLVSI